MLFVLCGSYNDRKISRSTDKTFHGIHEAQFEFIVIRVGYIVFNLWDMQHTLNSLAFDTGYIVVF